MGTTKRKRAVKAAGCSFSDLHRERKPAGGGFGWAVLEVGIISLCGDVMLVMVDDFSDDE